MYDTENTQANVFDIGERLNYLWWIVGFYWITAGGQVLIQEAPKLYWYNALIFFWVEFFVTLENINMLI